jgi:hypothetical protein
LGGVVSRRHGDSRTARLLPGAHFFSLVVRTRLPDKA